jgi:putative CocE/NonD family hydrolase
MRTSSRFPVPSSGRTVWRLVATLGFFAGAEACASRTPPREGAPPSVGAVSAPGTENRELGTRNLPSGARISRIAVPMRDGVILRGYLLLPPGPGPFPVIVYRTPYGVSRTVETSKMFRKALERGYAVVAQDVRGRYESDGEYLPYQQEGRDGYDTIEWAARQPWSNGSVGTVGGSYPGAVQWFAAMESPPSLKAMVPANTYASPRQFFYSGGVWDGSWVSWVWHNIAPDARRRVPARAPAGPPPQAGSGRVAGGLPGATTYEEAERQWATEGSRIQHHLPLLELPDLKLIAPWYYEWLRHPPTDRWWDWAEVRGRYGRTSAAVLNLSGWHDEAYGPHGATTNFAGLAAARAPGRPRAKLIVGPWAHANVWMTRTVIGEREIGPDARIDYEETVMRWLDHHVRGIANGVDREAPVRVFVMGANRWRESDRWPLPGLVPDTLWLVSAAISKDGRAIGRLADTPPSHGLPWSSFVSDPANPVTDPYPERSGAHDYRALASRADVLMFETPPLEEDVEMIGAMTAEIFVSTDAPDTDLWVKVFDVAPDGTAWNLMSPGLDVIRASYRDTTAGRQLLTARNVYMLRLGDLLTANEFKKGHRIRVVISTTFFPHFSRNLHTGELETTSSRMRKARIIIHHDARYPSRLILPVMRRAADGGQRAAEVPRQ